MSSVISDDMSMIDARDVQDPEDYSHQIAHEMSRLPPENYRVATHGRKERRRILQRDLVSFFNSYTSSSNEELNRMYGCLYVCSSLLNAYDLDMCPRLMSDEQTQIDLTKLRLAKPVYYGVCRNGCKPSFSISNRRNPISTVQERGGQRQRSTPSP